MRELTSIEEKILDKVLYLIGKTGKFNVPVRAIAKEAGVNVSAINYYFNTKEEMLELVKEFYIANTLEAYAVLDNPSYSEEEKIILCANELIEYILKYPGITAILKEAKRNQYINESDRKIVETTIEMEDKFNGLLEHYLKKGKDYDVRKQTVFLSSVLYPALNFTGEDEKNFELEVKEKRLGYIEYVLDLLK